MVSCTLLVHLTLQQAALSHNNWVADTQDVCVSFVTVAIRWGKQCLRGFYSFWPKLHVVYSALLSILMSQRYQNVSFARAIRLGLKLSGYVIKEIDVATDTARGFTCNNEVNCLSFNSEIAPDQTGRFRCQLSDSDRFAGFDNFKVDIDFK